MPAKDTLDPDSVRTRLRVWFASHPGWHQGRDVAAALGVTDAQQRTAIIRELNRLTRTGDGVTSYRPASAPKRGPGTVYARPGTPIPKETQPA